VTHSLNDLRIVNTKVNMLPYKADPDRYGLPDFWETIEEDGDCEDFALAKLQRLKQYGWPITSLRLATCWCFPNHQGYHCVLLADFEGQTYVLDNRYPLPMEWDLMPYEWDKLQVAGKLEWEKA
jgi:predicted transglutaminase-like cysteine proteinase